MLTFGFPAGPTKSGCTAQQSTSSTAAVNTQAQVLPTGSSSHQTDNAPGNVSSKDSRSSTGSSKSSKPRKSDSSSRGSKGGTNKTISSREMLFRQLESAPTGGSNGSNSSSSSSSRAPVAEVAPDTSQLSMGRKSQSKARDRQTGQPETDAATDTIVASTAAPSQLDKGSSKARAKQRGQPETDAATVRTIVPDPQAADPSQGLAKGQPGSSKSKKKLSKQPVEDAVTSAVAHTRLADALDDLSSSTETRQEETGTHAERRAPRSANGMTKTVRVGDNANSNSASANGGTADRLDRPQQIGAINSNDAPSTAKGREKPDKLQAVRAAGTTSKRQASSSKASKAGARRSAVDQAAAAAAAVSADKSASAAKQVDQSGAAAAAAVSADKSASAAKQADQSGASAAIAVSADKSALAAKQQKSRKPSSADEPTPAAPVNRKKKRKQSTADDPPSSDTSADASARLMSSGSASTSYVLPSSYVQPSSKSDAGARAMVSKSYRQPSKAADTAVEEFLQAARAYRAERLRQRVLAGTKADEVLKKVEKKGKKADKAALEAVRRHKRSVKDHNAEAVRSFEAAQKDCFPSLWVAPDIKAQSKHPWFFVHHGN